MKFQMCRLGTLYLMRKQVRFEFGGNMNSIKESLVLSFEGMVGKDTWMLFEKNSIIKENSSVQYLYSASMPITKFKELFPGKLERLFNI